ncbi:MAG TPA: hypothetical protein VGV93_09320 [Acidimicrobiales bacterium]|nr:hypothetical protein [Acidimicrobiales bacterium]
MSEPAEDDLPPLGRRTPARPPRTAEASSPRTSLVALLALAAGLVVGIPVGTTLDGGSDEQPVPEALSNDVEEAALPTTTVATLPPECVETIRSAQQALLLLDEGLQSLGDLDVLEVERVLADMERLRQGFARRAQQCLEDPVAAPMPKGQGLGE